MIKNVIENHQKTYENIFNDLKNRTTNSNAQCLLEFFYFNRIGTVKQLNTAFEKFNDVANKNNDIGKFYLGECFRCGYGTKKDPKSAIKWHEEARIECARSTD
ncbi:5939_t:CDS:1, partial [Scutellospora calospora]